MRLNKASLEWTLAAILALLAGYVDGYGFLYLGTYVSFMSGNTTTTALKSTQGDFHAALPSAIAIGGFLTGSFLGNLLVQSRLAYAHRLTFGVIFALLASVAWLEGDGVLEAAPPVAILSLAMGLLNPALSKIGGETVSLTFVTGTLSRLGGHLAAAARSKALPDALGPEDDHISRARIDASLWAGFLTGAALASAVVPHSRVWALLPPSVFMLLLTLLYPGTGGVGRRT